MCENYANNERILLCFCLSCLMHTVCDYEQLFKFRDPCLQTWLQFSSYGYIIVTWQKGISPLQAPGSLGPQGMCSTGPFRSFLASTETKCPNKSTDRTGIAKTIPLSYLKAIEKLPSQQSSSENKYILFSDQRHTSKRIKQNSKKQEQIPSEENLAHHMHHVPLLTHLTQRMQLFHSK